METREELIRSRRTSLWDRLKTVHLLVYVPATVVLSLVVAALLELALAPVLPPDEVIGRIDVEAFGLIPYLFLTLLAAPLFETAVFQGTVIEGIQRFIPWRTDLVAVSTSVILFSGQHAGRSWWYVLLVLPLGLVLAGTYRLFQERSESEYVVTAAVHALWNVAAVLTNLGIIEIF